MTLAPIPDRDSRVTGLPPGAHIDPTPWRKRNSAASVSLFCAILWPVSLLVPLTISLVTQSQELPGAVVLLSGLSLNVAPIVGIVSGHIALYRSLKDPALRPSRWRAIVGLAFGYLWLVALLFISDAGVALIYWFEHLR
jgi:hypothetical protein